MQLSCSSIEVNQIGLIASALHDEVLVVEYLIA